MLKNKEDFEVNIDVSEDIKTEPIRNIDIQPGSYVNIIGTNTDVKGIKIPENLKSKFSVSQILKNGNYSVLADNGIILEIAPSNIKLLK